MGEKTDKLVCPICGAPTRTYMGNARKDRLCAKHADEFKSGLIEKCEDCGEWHVTDESCVCNQVKFTELPTEGFNECVSCGEETEGYAFCLECWKKYTNNQMLEMLNQYVSINGDVEDDADIEDDENDDIIEQNEIIENPSEQTADNNVVVITENSKSKCITCGKKTDGLLFCSSCYYKYKNKELLFKITNCTNVELLDESYEGRLSCKDGHIVKSKSERAIDDYLFDNGIKHTYEKALPYGAKKEETLHPDFCLPDYLGKDKHVYIEHWGYNENNIKYTRTKKFKMPIYKELCEAKKMTLICTYETTDINEIYSVLDRKLNKSFIKENEVNFEE